MRIGIDIDDTITNTSELLLNYMDLYGSNIDFNDIRNNKADIMRGEFNTIEVQTFITNYFHEIAEKVSLKPGVIETINFIRQNGHEVHIITARSQKICMFNIDEVTQKYFAKYQIPFDSLNIGILDKKAFCMENNINVMIDDSIKTLTSLSLNADCLLFNSMINSGLETTLRRVDSWLEIGAYIAAL